MLKFLQSTEYENKKTLVQLLKNKDWKESNIPVIPNKNIIRILNSGVVYIHGRDNRYRPNIVICSGKFESLTYPFDDLKNSVVFILEYCINNMLIPGQIENWNIIWDLTNAPLNNIPTDLKSIISIIQQ